MLVLAVAAMLAAGCGGGGGSSSGGGGGGGGGGTTLARLTTFLSDTPGDYFGVYVNLYKVELVKADGSKATLFDSTNGTVVNLTNLRDTSGALFQLLSSRDVATGSYSSATVTVGKVLSIQKTQFGAYESRALPDPLTVAGGKVAIPVSFSSALGLTSDSSMVLDFVLASWIDDGTIMTPVINRVVDNASGTLSRQVVSAYSGTVSSLSASGFTLQFAGGGSFAVSYSDTTGISANSGAANPALANGQTVEVKGQFSLTSTSLVASSIRVLDATVEAVSAKGTPTDLDDVNGTITVDLMESGGFLPTQPTLTIKFNGSTKFLNDAGAEIPLSDFLELVFLGNVRAEGSFSGSQLIATKLSLTDIAEEDGGGAAEGTGLASDGAVDAGTFRVKLSQWYGFLGSAGALVNVSTGTNTIFEDKDGFEITDADFFDALTPTSVVKVKGTLSANGLSASRVILQN